MKNGMPHILATLMSIVFLGAGCLPAVKSPNIAEPLTIRPSQLPIPKTNGFGQLPPITFPTASATIKLATSVPNLPIKVTVIRPRHGTPNDTEFRNLSNALGISDGFIGALPTIRELVMEWTDGTGNRWSYRGSEHLLEFTNPSAPTEPVTVAQLPSNASVIQTATEFLVARGVNPQRYRDPSVSPDWNQWWTLAQAAKRCVDARALSSIRAIASSVQFLIGNPPALPPADTVRCLSPEFPSKLIVRFGAVVDGRDVVRADGSAVFGVELVVDAVQKTVVSGRITLTADPDRSDYAALTSTEATDLLLRGGLSGLTGNILINAYDFASMRFIDSAHGETYLLPSLIAKGIRTRTDGSQESVSIVVPLVAQ